MNPLTKKLLTLGTSAIIAVIGGYMIMPWEGMENHAYRDIVGIPTLCFGETKGVKMGDYRTDEQCEESLSKELAVYNQAMKKYVKVPLRPYEEVAYTSFVWNLGETNFRNSTLLKKLNAGDRAGACNELLKWNRAGGVEVRGLTNRRLAEHKTCVGKDERVNEALKALIVTETAPETLENTSGGGSQPDVEIIVSSPPESTISPLPANEEKTVVVESTCKWKFFNICLKKT